MKNYLSIFLIFVVFFGVTTVGFAQIKTGGYKKLL